MDNLRKDRCRRDRKLRLLSSQALKGHEPNSGHQLQKVLKVAVQELRRVLKVAMVHLKHVIKRHKAQHSENEPEAAKPWNIGGLQEAPGVLSDCWAGTSHGP